MKSIDYNYFTQNDFVNVDDRNAESDKAIPYCIDLSKYEYDVSESSNIIANILNKINDGKDIIRI